MPYNLRQAPIARLMRLARNSLIDVGLLADPRAFHGDRMLQRLLREILLNLPVTAFVETGSYQGDSTQFVARIKRNMPVFTCEVNPKHFDQAQLRLREFRNVEVSLASSEAFLKKLALEQRWGDFPVFWLDAHWYDYWPLRDEINIITAHCEQGIIGVDDFQVPGRDDCVYCLGGGGSPEFSQRQTTDCRPCNWDLIKDDLCPGKAYHALYPAYSREEALGAASNSRSLIGYVLIAFGLADVFLSRLMKTTLMKESGSALTW